MSTKKTFCIKEWQRKYVFEGMNPEDVRKAKNFEDFDIELQENDWVPFDIPSSIEKAVAKLSNADVEVGYDHVTSGESLFEEDGEFTIRAYKKAGKIQFIYTDAHMKNPQANRDVRKFKF